MMKHQNICFTGYLACLHDQLYTGHLDAANLMRKTAPRFVGYVLASGTADNATDIKRPIKKII